jgi:hypothetical protein
MGNIEKMGQQQELIINIRLVRKKAMTIQWPKKE